MLQWSDGQKYDRNETARLKYRQDSIARVTSQYRQQEIDQLLLLNKFYKAELVVAPKCANFAQVGGK